MKFLTKVAAVAAFAWASSANAVLLSYENQNPGTLTEGDSFTVDVVVSELNGEIVSAYDFNLTFDDALLGFGDLTNTLALDPDDAGDAFYFGPDAFGTDAVNVAAFSLYSDAELLAAQGGDTVTLFSVTFDALDAGMAMLGFDIGTLAFIDIKGNDAQELDVDTRGLKVTIDPRPQGTVPEPGTIGLMALGLVALGLRRRRTA